MPDENWEREAGKVDPDGFQNLENLTKQLLNVSKEDLSERAGADDGLSKGLGKPKKLD